MRPHRRYRTTARRAAATLLFLAPMAGAAQAAPDSTAKALQPRDPATAFVIAIGLPGAGHFYAHENNRGWLHLALHFAGAPMALSGRTDGTAKAVGVVWLANYFVSLIDAPRAVGRYNRRLTLSATPPSREAPAALRLGIAFSP